MKRWQHALALAATALAAHAATLWAYPTWVMWSLSRQTPAETERAGVVVLPPPVDHTARRVVMPSPDLLYALCPYDLRGGPWRIRVAPAGAAAEAGAAAAAPRYWSLALYAANSDNWATINDRAAGAPPLELTLRRADQAVATHGPAARDLVAPGARGLVLMRVLVDGSAASLAAAEAARRTLRCGPLAAPREERP